MQRFTISLDDQLARAFDDWNTRHGYANRSEAVRDLLRAELERSDLEHNTTAECVASLSYVYDRHELDVARRLSALHHDHHDLLVSAMHVPLDHAFRLETLVLRGKLQAVHRFADQLCAQRGVRHGKLNLIGVELHHAHRHTLDGEGRAKRKGEVAAAPHLHIRPAH